MLESLIRDYAFDTENPQLNYKLGLEYERIGHTAAAISYFLRAAERTDNKLLSYECLIRIGNCFDRQQNRPFTVKSMYRRAITLMPERPEAYYFMAKYSAWETVFIDTLMFSSLAFHNCKDKEYEDLNVGYPGFWSFHYYNALSSWWNGRSKESREEFEYLKKHHFNDMDHYHRESVMNNLTHIYKALNITPEKKKVVDYFTFYAPTMKEMLKLRIHMLKDYVDEFVISELNKTHSGIPVEYQLEKTLRELNIPNLKVKIIKVEIPEEDDLVITDIDRINAGTNNNNDNSLKARVRERLGIDSLLSVLDHYDNDTVFIISDADEIMRPESIDYVSNIVRQHQECIIRLPMVLLEGRADLRVYNRETNQPMEWTGAVITTKQHLLKATPAQMRSNALNPFPVSFITHNGKFIQDLGWHFCSMGGKELVKFKFKSSSHYDDLFPSSLINDKFSSKEKMNFIDSTQLKEGEHGVSAEKNRILKKYPVEDLPKVIFDLPSVKQFLFPEEITSTKNDTKVQVQKLYAEYDSKYGNWGWSTLDKAGCLIDYVDELCQDFPNPVCVEIGVYGGKSTLPMALELKRHARGKLYAIDPWSNEEATKGYDGPNYDYWSTIDLNHIRGIYDTVLDSSKLRDYVTTIADTSDNAPTIENINLLYIDGQHTDQAIRDANKYASQVVIGGYCIVDDVTWGDVARVPDVLESMGFVYVHSVDTAAVFKKFCTRYDVDGAIGYKCGQ